MCIVHEQLNAESHTIFKNKIKIFINFKTKILFSGVHEWWRVTESPQPSITNVIMLSYFSPWTGYKKFAINCCINNFSQYYFSSTKTK